MWLVGSWEFVGVVVVGGESTMSESNACCRQCCQRTESVCVCGCCWGCWGCWGCWVCGLLGLLGLLGWCSGVGCCLSLSRAALTWCGVAVEVVDLTNHTLSGRALEVYNALRQTLKEGTTSGSGKSRSGGGRVQHEAAYGGGGA
eukprot:510410-Rhodomonas_salina.1